MIVNTVGIILEYMFTRERITEETMNKGRTPRKSLRRRLFPCFSSSKSASKTSIGG